MAQFAHLHLITMRNITGRITFSNRSLLTQTSYNLCLGKNTAKGKSSLFHYGLLTKYWWLNWIYWTYKNTVLFFLSSHLFSLSLKDNSQWKTYCIKIIWSLEYFLHNALHLKKWCFFTPYFFFSFPLYSFTRLNVSNLQTVLTSASYCIS